MRMIRIAAGMALLLLGAAPAMAQFGPPAPASSGPKIPPVTVFPQPGSYPTTESVTLRTSEPGAVIHYTWDGSNPTANSPTYDPLNVLFIAGLYDGDKGLHTGYTIRAVATKQGMTTSDPVTFQYTIDRRDRTAYVSEEILPGVRMIRDSDNDKMFLIQGRTRNVLIDSGQGRGDLKTYLAQYEGGKPLTMIFTHNHGDHIGQADQFIANSDAYIGEADRAGLVRTLTTRGVSEAVIAARVKTAADGTTIDMGDRTLTIYAAPGHTPGSVVILDNMTGNLFTGDSYGSNSPTIPDALWMQGVQTPLDSYLSMVKGLRAKLTGKVRTVMTGHNDKPLMGETYMNNLQTALQRLMDQGDEALVPSYRPAGLSQVVIGDRFTDPDWIAINVNRARYLPAPVGKIASLSVLDIPGATLDKPFAPATTDYAVTPPRGARNLQINASTTSSRASLTFDGRRPAATPFTVPVDARGRDVLVAVTSPDGTATTTYKLHINPAPR